MALIIEDGTGVLGADSYLSLSDARILAADYGYDLPVDDTDAEVALRNGAAYVDMSEPSFTGERLNVDQGLAWPRVDAYKCQGGNNVDLPSDSVPIEMEKAQVIAAATYGADEDPRPNDDGKDIAEEKVGPITIKYFEGGPTGGTVVITAANDAMRQLLCRNSAFSGYNLRTLRV